MKNSGGLRKGFRRGPGSLHLPAEALAGRHGCGDTIVSHITAMPTQRHEVPPRFSRMAVELIAEDLLIEPDHVYIIPANRDGTKAEPSSAALHR